MIFCLIEFYVSGPFAYKHVSFLFVSDWIPAQCPYYIQIRNGTKDGRQFTRCSGQNTRENLNAALFSKIFCCTYKEGVAVCTQQQYDHPALLRDQSYLRDTSLSAYVLMQHFQFCQLRTDSLHHYLLELKVNGAQTEKQEIPLKYQKQKSMGEGDQTGVDYPERLWSLILGDTQNPLGCSLGLQCSRCLQSVALQKEVLVTLLSLSVKIYSWPSKG